MPTKNEDRTLNKLFDLDVNTRGNVYINNSVSETVKKILDTVSDNEVQLKVDKIWVDEKYDNADIDKQKEVRNKGQNWANDLRADLTLVDRITGKPIDHVKGMKVASIPKITDRGTFLLGGNEYQFTKQARLKPGVYTKVQNNGEISSFFNVDKTIDFERGFNNNFRIGFDPDKKLFTMGYGTKNVPLISALRAVGVTDGEMRNKWGTDVFKANDDANSGSELRDQKKLYSAIFGILPPATLTPDKMKGEIKDRLFKTKLDPDTTRITLGKPYGQVDKDPILDASKKIIDIHRGDVPEDDRESLIFKSFYDVEDHLRERLIKSSAKIKSAMLFKLKKNKLLNKSLSSQSFDPFVLGTLTQSQLSNPPNQTNIMSIIGDGSKMTVMGEGGIGSSNAVTTDTRNISNSEVAFIDPLHTPEGSSIGTSVHTSVNTIKVGNELYAKFLHPSGEKTILRPIDVYDKTVAFPDQFDMSGSKPKSKDKMVKAVRKGELIQVPESKVDFIIPSHVDMFDTSVNMIPFLDSIQGNRGLTASKMQEQALPLKDRERPLFNVKTQDGKDLGKILGTSIATPSSKVDGEVVSVDSSKIIVKDKDGVEHKHALYDNFSLNAESFINSEPTVKVGDKVKSGQALADNNFTKDGHVSIGTNLRVAYMPYKGYNYEDSTIVSESAAKKLTSLHLYDLRARRSTDGVFSKSKYQAYYPEEIKSVQAAKLDKDGVVKVGERVDRGDTLIAHLEKRTPTADDLAIGRLDKQLKRDMSNNAVKWENDHVGVVTAVEKHGNNVLVSVKTEEPLKVADKLSGLHGNKHVVSKIVPDDQMPYNLATGERIEMTMSPIGVSNRINTSQLLENAAGKIAKKTGKPFDIQNFKDVDNSKMIMEELKKIGLSDKDILVDPETGKPFLNPVANGVSHILKLEHKVDHKFSARYNEGHDSNQQAISGGETGGKNLGRMEVAALLARGASENLKESYTIKGQRNDEYWRAMETGQSLPPPKKAFVWDKAMAMMNGSGINVEQKGKTFTLKPMTDKDILGLSSGELSNPEFTYRKKDMAPIKGGLFDPLKAGGMMGDNFTHFKLPEKVLNPVMASAAASLLGVPIKHLEEIMEGKKFIDKTTAEVVPPGSPNAISGGPAAEVMLSRIKVKEELAQAQEAIQGTTNSTAINKLNTKIHILRSLDQNGMKPTDYLISHVLVTPSKFRPMFAMGVDKTVIMSDVNDLYQQTANTKNALDNLGNQLDKTIKNEDIKNLQMAEIRGTLYKDVKAVAGLGDPTAFLHRTKNKKGFIEQIGGGQEKQTKDGFFQSKVLERRQDLVGRSTIILNPELAGDEMGIPKEMAAKIFQPFVMKKMVSWGYSPLEASKNVKDKNQIFERALQVVADERLVIANRAPTLHRWNMTAFKPKLTDGKAIEVPSIVLSRNFNADIDGDTFQVYTPISPKAMAEAELMKPSASMIKAGHDSILNTPQMDMTVGAWLVSRGQGGVDTKMKFDTIGAARDAFKANKFNYGDSVSVGGKKASFGMHEINSTLPDEHKKWDVELNQKNIEGWIKEVNKAKNGKVALALADKIKDVGNNYSTRFGFTLGVSDTLVDNSLKDVVVNSANDRVDWKKPLSIIKEFSKAKSDGEKDLEKKLGDNTMLGIGIKSGGNKGIGNISSISLMPGIVEDADGVAIPMAITRSYSEGLDTSGYWAAAHGARGGNIKKSISTSKPGWFTKDLINSVYETRINGSEPVDKVGVQYSVSDKKGLLNRFLAKDVSDSGGKIIARRNDIVTSDVVSKLNQNKIKSVFIQSPLTDPTPGDGFSAYSYGTDYDGKTLKHGDNIGIISAHTITEPATNLVLKAFHTGGAVTGAKPSGSAFDQLDKLMRFNKNKPDKATLASMDAKISDIKKSSIGGYDVILKSDDGYEERRYVAPMNEPTVKKGEKVSKGDAISSGTPLLHDILKYRGMPETQRFLVDQLDKINGEGKIDKRDLETIVRGVTNTTRIMRPGSSQFVSGDIAPLTTVEYYNNNNQKDEDVDNVDGDHFAQDYGSFKKHQKIDERSIKKLTDMGIKRVKVYKDRIKHEPFLSPLGIGGKAVVSEDWIARMAHNRLKTVLEEGASQGWKTDITDTSNPITQFVTGEYA